MGAPTKKRPAKANYESSSLMVRLDGKSKRSLEAAAKLRQVSVSDYVRIVTVPQAEREILAAKENAIRLSPEEQLAFWTALNEPSKRTPAQKKLGAIMRGEA